MRYNRFVKMSRHVTGTDRSKSVRDFQNCVGPGPVPGFEFFLGPDPKATGFGPWIPV